jgi:cytochrome b involved in lipid metabolism
MCIFGNSHINIKIYNKWYNVTSFKKIHPGGEKILRKYNNKDASLIFSSIDGHYNYLHTLDDFLIKDTELINKLNSKLNF